MKNFEEIEEKTPCFEEKISKWLFFHKEYIAHSVDDYQEKLHDIILCGSSMISEEEEKLVTRLLHNLLSLSFILLKNADEVERFYKDWQKK